MALTTVRPQGMGFNTGRRNMVINGAMQVAQRGTSATSKTTSGFYAVDRMENLFSGLGTWTIEQSTDAPDGFSNSFKMTATVADASPAASDYAQMRTTLEGNSLQHLKYGTSGALTTTVSFWVKATKTGSFTFVARNFDGNTRMFSKNVSISAADTWEYKTVTIPGDTGDTIDNDNGTGLELAFWVNAGSTFSGGSEMSTWAAQVNANKYLGTIDIGAAVNDAIQFTGFQFEVGENASDFEHRSYGEELARCQRYYYQLVDGNNQAIGQGSYYNSGIWQVHVDFPTTMRAAPDLIITAAADHYNITSGNANDSINGDDNIQTASTRACFLQFTTNVSGTQGNGGHVHSARSTSSVAFDAEL